ncbi:MAG: hypothetical protein QM723_22160 [Myxococcaceae bacterium]
MAVALGQQGVELLESELPIALALFSGAALAGIGTIRGFIVGVFGPAPASATIRTR